MTTTVDGPICIFSQFICSTLLMSVYFSSPVPGSLSVLSGPGIPNVFVSHCEGQSGMIHKRNGNGTSDRRGNKNGKGNRKGGKKERKKEKKWKRKDRGSRKERDRDEMVKHGCSG